MISIVTPTFNSEKYLEECILSIKNQDFEEYEHIIVDGGSTDKTLDIIKKYENTYPMRWISEKDNGMYDAIAKGFRMANGNVFCWLNSDDMYMPWTLKTVNNIFADTSVDWCVGIPAKLNDKSELYLSSRSIVTFPNYCIKRGWMDGTRLGCIQQESSFWRKELYERAGGIDANYQLAGDYDLWVRFAQISKLHSVNSILAGFRIHSGQKSENRKDYCNEASRLTWLQKWLNRLEIYRIINFFLKRRNRIIEI